MKVFIAQYSHNTSCHCHPEYDDRTRIIVALHERQALAIIKYADSDTDVNAWVLSEIDITKVNIFDEDGTVVSDLSVDDFK